MQNDNERFVIISLLDASTPLAAVLPGTYLLNKLLLCVIILGGKGRQPVSSILEGPVGKFGAVFASLQGHVATRGQLAANSFLLLGGDAQATCPGIVHPVPLQLDGLVHDQAEVTCKYIYSSKMQLVHVERKCDAKLLQCAMLHIKQVNCQAVAILCISGPKCRRNACVQCLTKDSQYITACWHCNQNQPVRTDRGFEWMRLESAAVSES